MARGVALVAALAVSLPAVSGAGGAATQQTPRRGGTLVFAQAQPEPACMNLVLERCAPGTAGLSLQRISDRVLESAFEVAPDLSWRPRLVSGVSFTGKPPFTLTYRIHPAARWSDDVPVTAQDFVFTHRMTLEHGRPDRRALHASVRSVRALDRKTLRVVLRERRADWRGLFSPVFPWHALRDERFAEVWRDRIDDPKTGRPIGTGPFLVERWERGRQVTLVRNSRYWDRTSPHLERLVVRSGVDAATVADGLRDRTVHVAYGFPTGMAADLRRRVDVRIVGGPSTAWEHLDLRLGLGGNPILQNKLVRRAIAYGIDRDALARQLTREAGLAYTAHHSAVFLSQEADYRPNWRRYRYRPQESQRLLTQAGCRRGDDGIFSCNGVRLTLRFLAHVSPGSIRPGALALLQAQLRQAGVDIRTEFAPQSAVFGPAGILERGDFDGVMFAWIRGSPAEGAAVLYGCEAAQNHMDYCQRLVTSDLTQAERILDSEQRARVLNRADARLAGDIPTLPLFQHPNWAAVTRDVRGFRLIPHTDALLGAENWWLDR